MWTNSVQQGNMTDFVSYITYVGSDYYDEPEEIVPYCWELAAYEKNRKNILRIHNEEYQSKRKRCSDIKRKSKKNNKTKRSKKNHKYYFGSLRGRY